ncbi:unnamed protein product [Urochloa humidicola]
MGKKPGGAGWLATVRKVFKPTKDQRHAKKQTAGEAEGISAAGGDAAEIVSVDHFPTAETSPEATNEGSGGGAVAWRELGEQEEVAGAARTRRGCHGMAAVTPASRVARNAAARGRTGSREERAAVRIQAFYRGYLARRARRALRGLVRLQALVRGHQVRRQVHLTMRSMQALVRAQARVRARRLTSHPNLSCRRATAGLDAAQRRHRPGLPVDLLVPRHQQLHHRGRLSFGHEIDHHKTPALQVDHQAPQRHSSASHPLQADGIPPRRHDAVAAAWGETAATYYAYGLQHQRQLDGLEDDMDERGGRWHWLDHCQAGVQASQQGPAETSYVTAAATDGISENTVEMEAAGRRSPTRDLYPVRPPAIPGYMAATQSARAKARMAPAAAPRAGARSRSGNSAVLGGGSTATAANMGWSMSHNGGNGGARVPQQRAGHSPESSCSDDRTPPALGGRCRLAFT